MVLWGVGFAWACGSSQSNKATLRVGEVAPEIMLQNQDGRLRTLSEHRGKPVVLYFYPKDATPGCTKEACAFRDAWERIQAQGAVVYGISTDDVDSHRRFHSEHRLPFDLLADREGKACRDYGVPLFMGLASRMTFIVDSEGRIARVFPEVDPAVHADQVVEALEELKKSK
ncbi:MAG: peroxiredoxin [Sandaracinaceae bacterium]|nr:peroxiredoxin [Sandaracinaceae bacterium]